MSVCRSSLCRSARAAFVALAVGAASSGLVMSGAGAAHAATALPAHVFAPYFEAYSGDSPAKLSAESGAKYLTLAFIQTPTKGSCTPTWNGSTSTPISTSVYGADIATIRSHGGDVIPSFGGYSADHGGTDIADSCTNVASIAAAYEDVITTYDVTRLDLDIEDKSLTNSAGITRRDQAVAQVEARAAANGRTIQFSYTLPSTTTGLDSGGTKVMQDAAANGARVDVANIMTFDYYDGASHEMATDTETAASGLVGQLAKIYPSKSTAQLWGMVGVTEMIGIDDYGPAETFTTGDAATVLDWAQAKGISTLSVWALERDNGGCVGTKGSDTCSGIAQSTWFFSNAFEPFTSGTGTGGGGTSYEAESATLAGSAKAVACAPCSGGKDVTGIGGGIHGTVTFSNVTEPAAGSYTLSLYYVSTGKARSALVTINGAAQTVTFPATAAGSVGAFTLTVHLNAGTNTVEISGSGSKHAPDLDRITV